MGLREWGPMGRLTLNMIKSPDKDNVENKQIHTASRRNINTATALTAKWFSKFNRCGVSCILMGVSWFWNNLIINHYKRNTDQSVDTFDCWVRWKCMGTRVIEFPPSDIVVKFKESFRWDASRRLKTSRDAYSIPSAKTHQISALTYGERVNRDEPPRVSQILSEKSLRFFKKLELTGIQHQTKARRLSRWRPYKTPMQLLQCQTQPASDREVLTEYTGLVSRQ